MTEETWTIRPARAEDAGTLGRLVGMLAEQMRAYDGPPGAAPDRWASYWRDRFVREAGQGNRIVLVAEAAGGTIVGFVEALVEELSDMYEADRVGSICNMWVEPSHRRRQLGQTLVERVLECLRAKGCIDVTLQVALENDPAVQFYRKLGLRPVAYRMHKRL